MEIVYISDMGEIVNKISEAGIVLLDLRNFKSVNSEIQFLDLKDQLWNESVLREKDFRIWINKFNWNQFENKTVVLGCSNGAIIPAWAYMLIVAQIGKANIYYGNPDEAAEEIFFENLRQWDTSNLKDKLVMVKGCSDIPFPEKAYVILTQKLKGVVKSLMFGEPCSAVPVYKKKYPINQDF